MHGDKAAFLWKYKPLLSDKNSACHENKNTKASRSKAKQETEKQVAQF